MWRAESWGRRKLSNYRPITVQIADAIALQPRDAGAPCERFQLPNAEVQAQWLPFVVQRRV